MPRLSYLHARIQQLVHHALQLLVFQLVGQNLGDSSKQLAPLKVKQGDRRNWDGLGLFPGWVI